MCTCVSKTAVSCILLQPPIKAGSLCAHLFKVFVVTNQFFILHIAKPLLQPRGFSSVVNIGRHAGKYMHAAICSTIGC